MSIAKIHDLTLRDGLMARTVLPTPVKVELVYRLHQSGIRNFEVIRFPIDGKYPQFDEGIQLLEALQPLRSGGACLAAFAIGDNGIAEALEYADLYDELHMPSFVSDAYARYAFGSWNWSDSVRQVERTVGRCHQRGLNLTLGLGTCFGCPIQREHQAARTVQRFRELQATGVSCIMLGDTAGTATPDLVKNTLSEIRRGPVPATIRVHFHNTFGRALLNSYVALVNGADAVDASVLGLGGEPHPYFMTPALVDNGNCATEELAYLLLSGDRVEDEAAAGLFESCRWFVSHLTDDVVRRAAFAQLVPMESPNEVPQATYRH